MTEADKLREAMIALIAQNAELIKRIAELEGEVGDEQVKNGDFSSGMRGWTAYGEDNQ
jgi:hypothetical protein